MGTAFSESNRRKCDKVKMNSNNNILSVLYGQNSAIINALNPETLAFRNKVIELQKNCPMIEWEQDMGATVPCCKLDNTLCNCQCTFKTNSCHCDSLFIKK